MEASNGDAIGRQESLEKIGHEVKNEDQDCSL